MIARAAALVGSISRDTKSLSSLLVEALDRLEDVSQALAEARAESAILRQRVTDLLAELRHANSFTATR